jgi:hypothetical protein
MFLIVLVFALVRAAIGPLEYAPAMHLVRFPLSFIHSTVCPGESAVSVLFPFMILTVINATIRPALNTSALLAVFTPFAYIAGSISIIVTP